MKIQFSCLLLVLLCATELTEATKNFQIIDTMKPKDCTKVMKDRGLENNGNKCLQDTIFILSNEAEVNAVCTGGKGKIKSKTTFKIVDCTRVEKYKFPNCVYSGNAHDASVIFFCNNNEPERFVGAIRMN
ncbi:hypothetical protein PAMP_016428 [Pampus punctatissimus]